MAVDFKTTQELTDQNIAVFESKINQNVPSVDKSFVKVLSAVEAILATGLYKYGNDRILQNLVLTASAEDLRALGVQYGVTIKNAVAAVITATIPGTNGTTVNAGWDFIGDGNNERYYVTSTVVVAAGIATLSLTARNSGVAGNLGNGETLTIGTPIAGLTNIATVTATVTTGAEVETDASYRIRILDVIRSKGGGGNLADYRIWGQQVEGVERIYPYSGRPITNPTAPPPNRTLFVEVEASIDPDGIAPAGILTQVRAMVTTDPVTGLSRQPLGLTDATLFIESISVRPFYVEIRGLTVPLGDIAETKTNIETALDLFFESVQPYIDGLDPLFERRDRITDVEISSIVQTALASSGASCNGVGFGLSLGVFITEYFMSPGEEAKLAATPTYV